MRFPLGAIRPIRRWLGSTRWLALISFGSLLVVCFVLSDPALARPGGGHSYSGGSSGGGFRSGGHSGGGGGGELIVLLIHLCVRYPAIGIPLIAMIIGGWFFFQMQNQRESSAVWNSAPPVVRGPPARVGSLETTDPDFSVPVFEDFVYRLYARAHGARGKPNEMEALAPYLSPGTRAQLNARQPNGVPISNVVVGALRILRINPPHGAQTKASIAVELEANMTSNAGARGAQTWYVVERWTLTRAAGVRSKPPGSTKDFPCPNCGAPFQSSDGTTCSYCRQVVNNGAFDWVVEQVAVSEQTNRAPSLTGSVPEQGNDMPTLTQPQAHTLWSALLNEDPEVTNEGFGQRLNLIFQELNRAWAGMDLSGARPFVSDSMFHYLSYWISAYQEQGLRNQVDGAQLHRWSVAKVTRDRYFDAVTVRVWASGRDYTTQVSNGRVVGGDRNRDRPYTEYWTLLRGARVRGATRVDKSCPQCGAPLKINQAGSCEYCHAHITSGEYDWVLSKIEQDESYRG